MAKKELSKREGKKYGLRDQSETHPNQWTATPQQELWIAYYLDTKSPTFGNAYASAVEAGFSDSYARNIASPSVNRVWVKEARDLVRLGPDHINQLLTKEALDSNNRGSDRIHALEVIAKLQGLFVERKVTAHVNIEQILNELDQDL